MLAVGAIASAAEAPSGSPARPDAPADLRKLVEQSNQQRDRLIAEHDALARQLKDATEEKRREIYEKMSEQKQAFEAAQSRYTQAKAQFSAQSNQNQYSELRAPNDGVIAQVLLDAGQVVAPGQPVLQWAQESAIQARIAVPERKVSGLSIGQQAKLVLWSGKEPLTAKIRDIAPLADPVTRTFAVLLDVNDPAHQVRLGMSATVHFNTEGQGQAFKLPIASLVASHTGAYVWVFDEQAGTVAKRVLTPYDVSDSTFLVKEGLKPGELVVTAGTHVLNEGQKVRRFIETQDLVKQAVKP